MNRCLCVSLTCAPFFPLFLAPLFGLLPHSFPPSLPLSVPMGPSHSPKFILALLSLPGLSEQAFILALVSNLGSLAWPGSTCQSCKQRFWNQEFLPSSLSCNQGADDSTNSKWYLDTLLLSGGAWKGQGQCQVETYTWIENPSSSAIDPIEYRTRLLRELGVGILLRGQGSLMYQPALEPTRKC